MRFFSKKLPDLLPRLTPDPGEFARLFGSMMKYAGETFHKRIFWGDRMISFDKSAGFLDSARFKAAYEAIRGSHIYDAYDSPHTIAWRLHTLCWAAEKALKLEGDFVECGVFKGDMAWFVGEMTGLAGAGKSFYLYDTFAGFSDKYSSPEDYPDNKGFFAFANKIYKDTSIYPSVVERFKDKPHFKIIRGTVPDCFQQALPERIAYLHMDLNSPAAEIGALEVLFDRVVTGGVIILDDYGWYIFRKQKQAEDAFFARRGYSILELPTGQGLLIK